MTNSKPKRRWYQFSLRTLLLVMLVFVVGVGWLSILEWRKAQDQRVLAHLSMGQDMVAEYEWGRVHKLTLRNPTRDDLTQLEHLRSLRRLHLTGSGMTDASIEPLKDLPRLHDLSLGATELTDAGLEHITSLTRLRFLSLSSRKVTDEGLKQLKGTRRLRSLVLHNSQVTDAGLEHLKDLPKLTFLWLDDTQVTDEGVKKLQQALPNCKIDH